MRPPFFDLVGDHSLNGKLDQLIRDGGYLLSMRGAADIEALQVRGVTGANLARQVTPERLERLADLVADGTLKRPEIETFSLENAARALEKMATHHVRGKLVIRMHPRRGVQPGGDSAAACMRSSASGRADAVACLNA